MPDAGRVDLPVGELKGGIGEARRSRSLIQVPVNKPTTIPAPPV